MGIVDNRTAEEMGALLEQNDFYACFPANETYPEIECIVHKNKQGKFLVAIAGEGHWISRNCYETLQELLSKSELFNFAVFRLESRGSRLNDEDK